MKLTKMTKEEWNNLANDITIDNDREIIMIPDWIDAEIRNGKNEKWLKKAMVLKAMHPSYELTIYHMVMINL